MLNGLSNSLSKAGLKLNMLAFLYCDFSFPGALSDLCNLGILKVSFPQRTTDVSQVLTNVDWGMYLEIYPLRFQMENKQKKQSRPKAETNY